MRFFCDNCISPPLSEALHILSSPEHEVVHLRERFSPNTPDIEWISALAEQGGWVVVSGDLMILKRPAERDAWRKAKLTTFFFSKGFMQVPKWDQISWAVSKWPSIIEMSSRVTPGAGFRVPKKGNKFESI